MDAPYRVEVDAKKTETVFEIHHTSDNMIGVIYDSTHAYAIVDLLNEEVRRRKQSVSAGKAAREGERSGERTRQ